MAIIALATDYGTRDGYVGAVKGVILRIAPSATIVDVSHEIEPFNVGDGAFVLRQAWPWFPEGTIFVAVVDPGVGTARRILVGEFEGRFLVAPDNGLVTWVHREFRCEAMHVAEDRRYFLPELSSTFHGRDMMAPVAAHLANGVRPRSFGRATNQVEILPIPRRAARTSEGLLGRIVYVDRFGNLVTNVGREQLAPGSPDESWVVSIGGESVGTVRSTFADVAVGSPIAYVGAAGLLEIAINQGRAVDRFGNRAEVTVSVMPAPPAGH